MSEYFGASASGIGAMLGCPARMVLPQSRSTGEWAIRGNILHNYCRLIGLDPKNRETALAEITDPKIRATAEAINLEAALDGIEVVAFERAYILNVKTRTVRIAGDNIERKYDDALSAKGMEPLGLYDVPATIDVVGMVGGIPVELDYKSGMSIGDPAIHWQRRVCSVALMIEYGTATAISRVAYIKEDGSIIPDGCEFSCMDIDDYCDQVVVAIDAVIAARKMLAAGKMPTVYPSDENCKYCPGFLSCPAHTNFAKAMLGKLQAIENGPELSALTPSELGAVWEMLKTSEAIVKSSMASLKIFAEQGTIPVGTEHEIRPQQKSRSYFDQSKARGLLTLLMTKAGSTDTEITDKIKSLTGETKYTEFRKVKIA
jgi:hypothetical protein